MRPKTRRRLPLSLSAALLALGLTACDPASQAMLAGASLVSFVHTDKTVGDHFATWAFAKDCSTLTLANGEGYCRAFVSAEEQAAAEAAAKAEQAATYCYRTLGDITCYRRPDPMASSAVRVP
ncbi:MAG TPA: hypothetical protein VIR38_13685 [Thalassobaculum sp.]